MRTNTYKKDNSKDDISLEKLSKLGSINNKGKRKNIKHLWSSKTYPLDLYKNMLVPVGLREDLKRDSFFNFELSDLAEYLVKAEEEMEIDEAEAMISLELLLYMASKCFKTDEFPIENIFLVLSGITKAMPSDWDINIVYKINTLFKAHYSKSFIMSLYEEYRKVNSLRRLFNISDSSFPQVRTAKDLEDLEHYKKSYEELKKSEEDLLKNVGANTEVADILISGFKDKERYYKGVIKELSTEKQYEYLNVTLKKGTVNANYKIKLFDKIIESHHPYMYTTVLIPFPDAKQCKGNSIFLMKKGGNNEDKNPFISDTLDDIYSKASKEAIHKFSISDYSEDRKVAKRKLNLNKYTFNLLDAANMMDEINGGDYWKKRIEGICFKRVIWADNRPTVKMDLNHTMTLKEASHIIGMLGAGKSTFMRLLNFVAVKNGLKTVIITAKKESSIETYLDILSDNENLIKYYNCGKVSIFTGYSNRQDSINHLALQGANVLRSNKSLTKAIMGGLNIFDVTECSSVIASRYKRVFDEEYTDSLETILCSGDKGVFNVANIEYKENAIYKSLENLTTSDTWVGNIHAFLHTKCPYQLDILCRDFLTIVNTVADLVIIDEIDEIQAIADKIYNVDYGIATSFAKDSNKMVVDYLYREMVGVDRSAYRNEADRVHGDLIRQQQGVCDSIMSYLSKNERRASAEYTQFSYYSLKFKFIKKYFNIEIPTTSDMVSFSEIIDDTNVLPHEGFKNSKLKEYVHWVNSFVLGKKDTFLLYHKKSEVFATKQHIDKMGQEYGNIDFYHVKDKSSQIAYRNLHMYETLKLIAEKLGWEIRYENVITKIDDNKSRINSVFTSDFEFLVLTGELDSNQKRIDYDTVMFANRVGMKFDMASLTNTNILPLFPDPLVKRAYTYSYKAPRSKNSPHKLNIKNYLTIGRDVLFNYRNTVESLEGVKPPIYAVMSASSYFNQSSSYNVAIKPSYIIKNDSQNETKIDIKKKFIKFGDKLIKISGNDPGSKRDNIENMFTELVRENFFDREIEYLETKYEESQECEDKSDRYTQRQIVSIAVPSYEIAEIIARHLIKIQSKYNVKCLFRDNKTIMGEKIEQRDYHVKVDEVDKLCNTGCDIFVFVMPAIGRGYNMLQKKSKNSLIGTIMFPVRPFMHPEDEMYMIYALHCQMDSMIEEARKYCLDKYGRADGFLVHKRLKRNAMVLYNKMFNSSNFWKTMNDELRYWMVANFLVSILQTMGRGMRGGTDLRVYLMDAAFVSNRTIKAIEESEANVPINIEEEKTESFLSVCMDILSKGDEIFNLVNKPLVDGFANIEWGI